MWSRSLAGGCDTFGIASGALNQFRRHHGHYPEEVRSYRFIAKELKLSSNTVRGYCQPQPGPSTGYERMAKNP